MRPGRDNVHNVVHCTDLPEETHGYTDKHCPKYDDNVSFQGLLKFAPT